jgi:hypothetical protein
MLTARCRYRSYPTPGQERIFRYVQVVFNDAPRAQEVAHGGGERLSDTEVQRRVITAAKSTSERVWLPEVALVQACQAYRNFVDSLSGRRKGRRVGPRLVRDNRAVYGEDLAVSGPARTRLATSVHDAGWATLVGLLEEKAARHHRTVVKIGRWFPSTRLRDLNAARNIQVEGHRVAAGPAETSSACGADVRPEPVPAVGVEAGTRRGAA